MSLYWCDNKFFTPVFKSERNLSFHLDQPSFWMLCTTPVYITTMVFNIAIVFLLTSLLIGAFGEESKNDLIFKLAKQSVKVDGLEKVVSELKKQDNALKEKVSKLEDLCNVLKGQVTTQAAASSSKEKELQMKVAQLEQRAIAFNKEFNIRTNSLTYKDKQLGDKVSSMTAQQSVLKDQVTKLETQASKALVISAFLAGFRDLARPLFFSKALKDGIVRFNEVKYMHGRGFDSSTGKFTAPVHGLYVFHVVVLTTCGMSAKGDIILKGCHGQFAIKANGKNFGEARPVDSSKGNDQASTSAVVELKPGQEVFVEKIYGSAGISDFPFSTFSGYLVKPF